MKPSRSCFKVSGDRGDNSTADTSGLDKSAQRSRPVVVGDVFDAAPSRRRSATGSLVAGGRKRGPEGEGPGPGDPDPDPDGDDRPAAREDRDAGEDDLVKPVRHQLKPGCCLTSVAVLSCWLTSCPSLCVCHSFMNLLKTGELQ